VISSDGDGFLFFFVNQSIGCRATNIPPGLEGETSSLEELIATIELVRLKHKLTVNYD